MTDTIELNEIIKKSGLKKEWLAKQLGLSRFGLQKKIKNEVQFKAEEIKKLCNLLGITTLEGKERIFFVDNVDETTTK